MPTLLRQKKVFLKLPQSEQVKFLNRWVSELEDRYREVVPKARHDVALITFGKSIIDVKIKCDILASKSKAHLSSAQLVDFNKRCSSVYETLKNHDKTLFGFERDILRPNSDGAKKQKLVADVRGDFGALEDLLNEVKLKAEDAVNLYDSYGSNKDVLDAVNNGRKLATGLASYRDKFLESIKRLEDTNAKIVNIGQEKDSFNDMYMRNLGLIERSENYLKMVKGLSRKYRGVTRKIAKDLGVLKPHWYPSISRKLDKSGHKSGSSLLVKRLRDLAYSGADVFPDPATLYLKEIRAQRVNPHVKELISACILLGTDKLNATLIDALTLVKDVVDIKQHSTLLAQDVSAVKDVILSMLSSPEVKKHSSYSPANKALAQKVLASSQATVVRKYNDAVVDYVEKYLA
jgi:hypothetical protein